MSEKKTATAGRIPATIISGFLGSGKTTLLNRILQADLGLRVAVLVNDFGSINIDSQLIKNHDGKVMSLANGCICCSIADDLAEQIDELISQDDPPQCILIESSGVSDPGRIARILNYRLFRDRVRIDAIINMIDADQFDNTPEEFRDLAHWQLKQADIVVINKIDLCDTQKLAKMKQQWLPEHAKVFETTQADVPLSLILDVELRNNNHRHDCMNNNCKQDHSHDHDDHSNLFESIAWQSDKPVDITALKIIVKNLPKEVYRAKGIFIPTDQTNTQVIMQRVGNRTDWSEQVNNESINGSSLILIAKKDAVDLQTIKTELDLMCRK